MGKSIILIRIALTIALTIGGLADLTLATSGPAEAFCRSGMSKWSSPSVSKQLYVSTSFPSGMRSPLAASLSQWNRSYSALRYSSPRYTTGWLVGVWRGVYDYSSLMGSAPGYAATLRNGGTHTGGSLYLNPGYRWVVGSQNISAGVADVQTVAVHEVGHFTGLAHPWYPHCTDGTTFTTAEKSSVMNAVATGTRRTLNSDDIAGVRAIY